MEKSGYYSLIQLTPESIIFTRTLQQRRETALILAVLGLVALSVAIYSLFRPTRELFVFIFFLLTGVGVLVAALLALTCWMELEFDAPRQQIIKRRHIFGKVWVVETLPYCRCHSIRVVKHLGEYDVTHLKLIIGSGHTWASLPGYFYESQALSVRHRIQDHMRRRP
jgi:hypothetical protein